MNQPLPGEAVATEHGWRLDLPGRIDPRPSLHWSTAVVGIAAIVIGAVSSPWLTLPFLLVMLITLNPRGTPIHGLELHRATFAVLGLPAQPLHHFTDPVARPDGIDLTIDGVRRTLVFEGEPPTFVALAARLARDLEAHGGTEDVPASMQDLREADA